MAGGPLIPGLKEFDRPKRGLPAWVLWLAALIAGVVVLAVVGGLVGGVGPLGSLGLVTSTLQPISYRPTASESVVQIAVAVPASGICRDDRVLVVPFERGDRVSIEATLTRPRNASCEGIGISEDRVWIDVPLDGPLGLRGLVRASDGASLQREGG